MQRNFNRREKTMVVLWLIAQKAKCVFKHSRVVSHILLSIYLDSERRCLISLRTDIKVRINTRQIGVDQRNEQVSQGLFV